MEASDDRLPADAPRLKTRQSLERLRERVRTVTEELLRLREENAALAERLQALEARVPDPEATVLTLDAPPEDLERRLDGFIDAIDRYLSHSDDST